jgi:hypothetical protein
MERGFVFQRQIIMAFLIFIGSNLKVSAYNPMAQFTVQFAQVILNPKMNVHSIRQRDDLFILEGVSENQTIIHHLAEDILGSRKLNSLKLLDAVPTFDGKKLTLFISFQKRLKNRVITVLPLEAF